MIVVTINIAINLSKKISIKCNCCQPVLSCQPVYCHQYWTAYIRTNIFYYRTAILHRKDHPTPLLCDIGITHHLYRNYYGHDNCRQCWSKYFIKLLLQAHPLI